MAKPLVMKTGQMFQLIDNELNDHGRAHWCGDRRPIAQRMPGAPVLQRCLIGTRGIARRAFMEEGTPARERRHPRTFPTQPKFDPIPGRQ